MKSAEISDYMELVIKRANYSFTAFFTLECILKLLGQGKKLYFKDGWNKFDFFIVVFSLVVIIYEQFADGGLTTTA
jgi:hypothetical protein